MVCAPCSLADAATSFLDAWNHAPTWQRVEHVVVVFVVLQLLRSLTRPGALRRLLGSVLASAKTMPGVSGIVAKEQGKILGEMKEMIRDKVGTAQDQHRFLALPEKPMSTKTLLALLRSIRDKEVGYKSGRAFGGIYGPEDAAHDASDQAYVLFSSSNALHPLVFPSLVKFESEVIRMILNTVSGDADACGAMTSGGTESILLAVKAYRDRGRSLGITEPEIVAVTGVHAALDKACEYFTVKLVLVPVSSKTYRASLRDVQRAITRNTVALWTSAPNYPHGIIDDVPGFSDIALKRKLPLHVDMCLGGFVLPFMKQLGLLEHEFDFAVPGVTSISLDVHKYGHGPKGTSTVLWRNTELRKFQYTVSTDWPGGLYCSPSMCGSRPGGLIAGAWAAMIATGKAGYDDAARQIDAAFRRVIREVQDIDGLELIGPPDALILAVASPVCDVYRVADRMAESGWSVDRLHNPRCLHVTISLRTAQHMDAWVRDLKAAVAEEIKNPKQGVEGMAPIYGMAATIPDRSMVKDLMCGYMDAILSTD